MSTNPRPNPYVGPRAFEANERFYGRETETRRLVNLLLAERIVLLYSPSGAGKTSLIQAALIPELQGKKTARMNFNVRPVIRVGHESSRPPEVPGYNRYLYSVLSSLESAWRPEDQIPGEELATLSLEDYLERRPKPEGCNYEVFIFDQFEEILTLNPTDIEAKEAFFTAIGELLEDRSRWALFSMREDFIAALEPYTFLIPTNLSNTFRLDLLGVEAARLAIQNPVSPEVEFKDEAARKLVDDLCTTQVQHPGGKIEKQPGLDIEPVQLQVVCYRLWENLGPDDVQIDIEDVEKAGDVDIALASYYAECVSNAARETGLPERDIREWIDRRLISKQGIRGQVLRGSYEIEGLQKVIDLLDKAHLVRSERRGSAYWIELSHDRLVLPVQKNNAEWYQVALRPWQRQAALWHEQGQREALLLRGEELAKAEAWAQEHAGEINEVEKLFLKSCLDLQKREQADRAIQAQQLKLDESKRRTARLRWALGIFGVMLLITFILAAVAISQGNQARANENDAKNQAATAMRANQTALYAQGDALQQAASATYAQGIAQQQEATAKYALATSDERGTQIATQVSIAKAQRALAEDARATAEAASTQAAAEATKSSDSEKIAIAALKTAVAESTLAAAARQEAETQLRAAHYSGLLNNAISMINLRPDLSLLLSVEAASISNTVQAQNALLTVLQQEPVGNLKSFDKKIPQQVFSIHKVKFSPHGNYLAWVGYGGHIVLWDLNLGEVVWQKTAHDGRQVDALAFSPDGNTLATGGQDGNIILWEVASGYIKAQVSPDHNRVLDLEYNPQGTRLASCGYGSKIYVWNVQTLSASNDPLQTLVPPEAGYAGDVWSIAWSKDGKSLASGGVDKLVRIWDPAAGRQLKFLEGHQGQVRAVAWSPDGTHLASGGDDEVGAKDKVVLIWDVTAGTSTAIEGLTSDVYSLAYSPDGKLLGTGGVKTITLWNTGTLKLVDQASDQNSVVYTLAFSPFEQNLLATGGFDYNIFLYEIPTQAPLYKILGDAEDMIQGLVFNSDTSILAAEAISSTSQIYLATYDVQTGAMQPESIPERVAQLSAFSQDGLLVAFGDTYGHVQAMEIATGNLYPLIEKMEYSLTSLAFSPDSRNLAIGVCIQYVGSFCAQNAIALWDAHEGVQIGSSFTQLPSKYTGKILSLAFSPDGRTLASGGEDQPILFWDVETGETIGSPFIGSSDAVTSLAFSYPDGSMLASGSANGQMLLWDVATRHTIGGAFQVASSAITGLAFSLDGLSLVSGSSSGQIKLWDLKVSSWIERACGIVNRSLTQAEWDQYLTGEPYNPRCKP